MNIAIAVIAYNRTKCLMRLLRSLDAAHYTESVPLIISIDKSPTDAVERCADGFVWKHGEKQVVRHRENLGLRQHVLSIGQYLDRYDALVVLEDDITVAPAYMDYVQATVGSYAHDRRIAGISLYGFAVNCQNQLPFTPLPSDSDVYLMQIAQSWGQVWMKKQWKSFFDWYETHNEEFHLPHIPTGVCSWPHSSWLKYQMRYCIEQDKYFIYPYISLSTNNGDIGANFDTCETLYQVPILSGLRSQFRLPEVDAITVRYDGFFESLNLTDCLGIAQEELTVDLYGGKRIFRRYLLTTLALPYKVVRTFALEMRPWEANIINEREGTGIWLYDTTMASKMPRADSYTKYYHLFGRGFNQVFCMIGIRQSARILIKIIIMKIKEYKTLVRL